jgi:dephospho-CoA kinase
MFIIGITGGIGCGKTTVAQLCSQAGLPVIDADALSREMTATGGAAIEPIMAQFGKAVLGPDGALDRARMAKLVFNDRNKLDQLSAIVHREVIAETVRQIEQQKARKTKALVLDVPIPVREGFLDTCDQIWVVWAADDIRVSRLRGRGMPEAEARRRMAMQMNREEYTTIADHVIENDGDYLALVREVESLLKQELGLRGIRYMPLDRGLAGQSAEPGSDSPEFVTDEPGELSVDEGS